MWVLVFVAILNGEIHLDARPQPDKWVCEAKAKEMLARANKAEVPFVAACKEIKYM